MIKILPLKGIPIIHKGDNIAKIILDNLRTNNIILEDSDILVVAQTIISRAEGQIVNLDQVNPSEFAIELSKNTKKNPKHIEMVLREAKNICKFRNGVLVTETKHGFVCANSGIDRSNVPGDNAITLLPKDPDKSAAKIRTYLEEKLKINIAVIISDTHNRPFRLGAINIAIGCSGIQPLLNYTGKKDIFGYELKSSVISIADQLCSAAGLVMGEADEKQPIILIKGFKYTRDELSATSLIRPEEHDYFR